MALITGEDRRKAQALVREAKNVSCADCGRYEPPYNMHFDHVRGEKLFSVTTALYLNKDGTKCASGSHGVSKEKLYDAVRELGLVEAVRQEIAKCEVVCALCHGHRSWGP